MGLGSGRADRFTRFVLVFIGTIVAARLFFLFVGDPQVRLFGGEVHHFYVGIIVVLLAGFFRFFSTDERLNRIDLEVFAVGTGLIVDEYLFILATPDTPDYYFSPVGLGGGVVLAAVLIAVFYAVYREAPHP
ncbi:MAG: hypothetical protein ABEI97_00410 [Candidatus Nanohaloarchaea archaeon]